MFNLKKISTWIAASTIAFKTSAKFNNRRIAVARTAIYAFLTRTFVPNSNAKAVMIVLVISHIRLCPKLT